MAAVKKDENLITRIGCLAHNGEYYVTRCNIPFDQLRHDPSGLGLLVGNVVYPYPWYRGIDVHTEATFKKFKEQVKAAKNQQSKIIE